MTTQLEWIPVTKHFVLCHSTPAFEHLQICLAKLDTIPGNPSCWMIISKSASLSWGRMELEDFFFPGYKHSEAEYLLLPAATTVANKAGATQIKP